MRNPAVSSSATTRAISALLQYPLAALQGLWLRATVARLPEADGPDRGEVGAGPTLRLLVIGESTAAGVGVSRHAEGMAGHLASCLADRSGHRVSWRSVGTSGADCRAVRSRMLPRLAHRFDLAVVMLGVNDTKGFTSRTRWRSELSMLADQLPANMVVMAGVPPMGRFPALPLPLRDLLGRRARYLAREMADVCASHPRARYVPCEIDTDETLFAEDGFHPSAIGYRRWAGAVADAIGDLVAS